MENMNLKWTYTKALEFHTSTRTPHYGLERERSLKLSHRCNNIVMRVVLCVKQSKSRGIVNMGAISGIAL